MELYFYVIINCFSNRALGSLIKYYIGYMHFFFSLNIISFTLNSLDVNTFELWLNVFDRQFFWVYRPLRTFVLCYENCNIQTTGI